MWKKIPFTSFSVAFFRLDFIFLCSCFISSFSPFFSCISSPFCNCTSIHCTESLVNFFFFAWARYTPLFKDKFNIKSEHSYHVCVCVCSWHMLLNNMVTWVMLPDPIGITMRAGSFIQFFSFFSSSSHPFILGIFFLVWRAAKDECSNWAQKLPPLSFSSW